MQAQLGIAFMPGRLGGRKGRPVQMPAPGLGPLLRQAMEARSRDLGSRYTYRDLERDSRVSFTYAAKLAQAENIRRPSREVVEALSRALAPYLPLDDALVASGYLPQTAKKNWFMQWYNRLTLDQMDRLYKMAQLAELAATTEQPPDELADVQPDTGDTGGQNGHPFSPQV
jgi:hypothetical protein